jgi:UDP-2,3-diacylglucosamine hydrolase
MKTLFISDLHLDPEQAEIQNCFDEFIVFCLKSKIKDSALEETGSGIDAVYILGDLFEVWMGDDASIPIYQRPIAQLKQLTENHIKVFVMHGNRDFLLGPEFEQASGCQLIPDPYHLTLVPDPLKQNSLQAQSQHLLLSHGDIFCTDDLEYLKFRKMVRDPVWKREFLSKSISERSKIAREMRAQSKQHGRKKQPEIMDVNQKTVEKIMSEKRINTLIHGHTHRPGKHKFALNNQPAQRIVLPDWNPDAKPFIIE